MVDQARLDRMYREVLGRPRPRSIREQTLQKLRDDVFGTRADRLRREMLDDPQAIRTTMVRGLRYEVEYPELFARAARVREFRELRRRREEQLTPLVASGDLSVDLRPFWQRLAAAGSDAATVLLASAARRQVRALTAAVVASGTTGGWKVRRVGDHEQAVREVWAEDGTITKHVRWRYRGQGDWLTSGQFEAKLRASRARQRRLARMIPASTVGRPSRRRTR
jgi:hypothetical protein